MKICRQCQAEKPETDFYRAPANRDGLYSLCKVCKNARQREYAQTEQGRKATRAAVARWKERNPGASTVQATEWRKAHPDRAKVIRDKWRTANREKQVESQRRWREAHPDLQKLISARWRREHPEAKPRYYARAAVGRAVKRGLLTKPERCQLCLGANGRIEAHHWNGYEAALDVIWLCRSCHSEAHRKAS